MGIELSVSTGDALGENERDLIIEGVGGLWPGRDDLLIERGTVVA